MRYLNYMAICKFAKLTHNKVLENSGETLLRDSYNFNGKLGEKIEDNFSIFQLYNFNFIKSM